MGHDGGPWLVAGLGNPGAEYAATRHNMGFLLIDRLADRFRIALSEKGRFNAEYGRGRVKSAGAVLVKPLDYMNRSGPPVRRIADYYRISSGSLLVVHDDMDLDFGRIKIKEKGGDGGHKGIRSLMDAFGGGDFYRLRMGIGRPGADREPTGHVLGRFTPDELTLLERMIERSLDAVVSILCQGARESMNLFNRKESAS